MAYPTTDSAQQTLAKYLDIAREGGLLEVDFDNSTHTAYHPAYAGTTPPLQPAKSDR